MHSLEIGALGRPRLERSHGVAEVGAAHTFEHCFEPLRTLGMARAGQMFEICRMGGEQHGHAVGRYLAMVESELPFDPVKPAMHH